jgi:hypothetical protein
LLDDFFDGAADQQDQHGHRQNRSRNPPVTRGHEVSDKTESGAHHQKENQLN